MKACTNCGSATNGFNKRAAPPDGLQFRCKDCQSESRKRYWLERERGNPETNVKRKKRGQAYNDRHPEKVRTAKAAYAEAHPEECKARIRAWQKEHPELLRVYAHRHRAEGPQFSLDDILSLKEAQVGTCAACRVSLADGYHIDHIVPVSKGGTNAIANIHLLCPDCNYRKQSMDYQVFLAKREAEIHALKDAAQGPMMVDDAS